MYTSALKSVCYYLSELKLEAVTMTSSLFWTNTGIFLQPGDFNNLWSSLRVSAETHRCYCELPHVLLHLHRLWLQTE